LGVRLRLQDMAYLMADTLVSALAEDPNRPPHFVNIAGVPAADSLNTLIVLNNNRPESLAQRQVFIDVLDFDEGGSAFGKAALAALSEEA